MVQLISIALFNQKLDWLDSSKNSGNIGKQTVTFSGLANPFVQSYTYDPLYRLTEVKETSNGTQTWKQTFGYDRYGNRTSYDKWLGTTAQTLTSVEVPAIDNTTNRISSSGYTFDANGNLIVDAEGRQFTFNGDNKQTKVLDDEDVTLGEYFFDGEGKRIKKVTASETTVFVYSGSKLIAEYSTATPPSNPTTSWTVTDQLGTPRVIVNALGAVVSRRDFMPFGEELGADGTYRTTAQKYGQTDSVRQRFTGYQKDEETGLDFAEARMYQNLHGRFTAIDPLLSSGKSADPQTFNRYVYVMNQPLTLTDPTGLQAGSDPDEKPIITIRTSVSGCGWNFGCWFKSGIDAVGRLITGGRTPTDTEDDEFHRRKEGGVEQQAGAQIRNYFDGLETLNEAVVENEPSGMGKVVKMTVKNSLGTATDMEVIGAWGETAVNLGTMVTPGGTTAKAATKVGERAVTGWVKREVFNGLEKSVQTKVASAIKTGLVAPKGKQGIIKLTAEEAKKTGFTHKLKILGKGGDMRIYGNQLDNGHIIFEKIGYH